MSKRTTLRTKKNIKNNSSETKIVGKRKTSGSTFQYRQEKRTRTVSPTANNSSLELDQNGHREGDSEKSGRKWGFGRDVYRRLADELLYNSNATLPGKKKILRNQSDKPKDQVRILL
jgi:hypothetical protein